MSRVQPHSRLNGSRAGRSAERRPDARPAADRLRSHPDRPAQAGDRSPKRSRSAHGQRSPKRSTAAAARLAARAPARYQRPRQVEPHHLTYPARCGTQGVRTAPFGVVWVRNDRLSPKVQVGGTGPRCRLGRASLPPLPPALRWWQAIGVTACDVGNAAGAGIR